MNWTIIKCLAAHIFADYGAQTTHMACNKNHCNVTRAQHVACVAGAFAVALATDDKLTWRKKALVILINTVAHFLIDSFRIHKAVDQALHSAVAVGGVLAVRGRK